MRPMVPSTLPERGVMPEFDFMQIQLQMSVCHDYETYMPCQNLFQIILQGSSCRKNAIAWLRNGYHMRSVPSFNLHPPLRPPHVWLEQAAVLPVIRATTATPSRKCILEVCPISEIVPFPSQPHPIAPSLTSLISLSTSLAACSKAFTSLRVTCRRT